MSERFLNPKLVETAEKARSAGNVLEAAEIAADGLGLLGSELTSDRILEITEDPKQRAVLACLARIYVDSTKTRANRSIDPRETLSFLGSAADVINLVYRDPNMQGSLSGVDEDHEGRVHHFLPEMKRDTAKTADAAKVLFPKKKAENLVLFGEDLLEKTYEQIPDNHPTKPLIGIELQLSRVARGEEFDRERLLDDFLRLTAIDYEKNPHRVATVASWLAVWGKKLSDEEIEDAGLRVFGKIIEKYPDWEFMIKNEKNKASNAALRRLFLRLGTPILTKAEDRDKLYFDIIR